MSKYLKWVGNVAIVVALAVCAARVEAQQPKKIPRIGYLAPGDAVSDSVRAEAIRRALRERGYIEGQNIATEYRYSDRKPGRTEELAAELVGLKVDILVVTGGLANIQAAKNATKTVPIVMTGAAADPVESGIIDSLARPGGNVTGLTNLITELGGKRLELFKEAVSKLVRIAFLYDPTSSTQLLELKQVQTAARPLGLTIQPWKIGASEDFDRVLAEVGKEHADGLHVTSGPQMRTNRNRIVGFALKRRLPSLWDNKEFVDAGGLMSYGADLTDSYRRVAYYVDKILKGAKPADLPVEQPKKFELVINLKTAKQIGLTIPPDVLSRATKIIR